MTGCIQNDNFVKVTAKDTWKHEGVSSACGYAKANRQREFVFVKQHEQICVILYVVTL